MENFESSHLPPLKFIFEVTQWKAELKELIQELVINGFSQKILEIAEELYTNLLIHNTEAHPRLIRGISDSLIIESEVLSRHKELIDSQEKFLLVITGLLESGFKDTDIFTRFSKLDNTRVFLINSLPRF